MTCQLKKVKKEILNIAVDFASGLFILLQMEGRIEFNEFWDKVY